MDWSGVHLSIDLVDAALRQRQFLQLVDAHPSLYAGPHVQIAIRRYELFWLPLVAQTSVTEDIAAPLDIAWVWHVHMLSPISYEKDCNEVVSTLVDHKILVGEQCTKGLNRARILWNELYPSEPFEVDLTTSVGHVPDFESRIEYDIAAACERQRVFYYQVSLPHYGDTKFLNRALVRYKQHLVLKQQNPDLFLVPCYDIDLIWHAHQVHPLIYQKDTTKVIGKVYDHNDSVNDRRPGARLTRSYETTRQKWKEADKELPLKGCMFRGEPPLPSGVQAELVDYTGLAALEYTVMLTRLEIEGLPKSTSYTVKIDVVNGERVLKTRVRGPAVSLANSTNVLSRFKFKTKDSNSLLIRICQQRRCPCFTPSFDESAQYLFLSFLVGIDHYNSAVEPEPVAHELAIAENVIVRFTTVASPPIIEKYFFMVKPKKTDFSIKQHPAQILSSPTLILSPMALAQSSSTYCAWSVNRLFGHGQREVFTYRIMHSAQLLFSSVEVINHAGRIVSTAHVIRGDILPMREQVYNAEKCCTIDEKAGERAILIRGSQDWGICVGKWKGLVQGVPGVPGTPGIKGQPGHLSIEFFSLIGTRGWKHVRQREDKFSIVFGALKNTTVDVDLRNGTISFPPEVHDVPEAIALGFSVAILHLLCQPYSQASCTRPSAAASGRIGKPRSIRNEDLLLVVAAGYYANSVPTNSYIKYKTGEGACGGCGGCGGCGCGCGCGCG